jgi:hypothetical protein
MTPTFTCKQIELRYWSGNNPIQLHEKPLHSEKVLVRKDHIYLRKISSLPWILIYGANIFRYKDKAKGEKCTVLAGGCNSPHSKATHDFS